ncbi:MAG: hypothetical protein H0X30_15580 [Anaerolineae bacterium]|nr:hypothetical protein [Anaerolineae bacterium]
MLKVIGIAELQYEILETSDYTLSLAWNHKNPEYGPYWRTGNFHDALIEIGLSDTNHSVKDFDVVIVPQRFIVQAEIFDSLNLPVEIGIPICEWTFDKPSPHYVDEALDVRMYIGGSSISICIGGAVEIKRVIVANRVRFGMDADGYLRAIQVTAIKPSEMANIRSTFPTRSG